MTLLAYAKKKFKPYLGTLESLSIERIGRTGRVIRVAIGFDGSRSNVICTEQAHIDDCCRLLDAGRGLSGKVRQQRVATKKRLLLVLARNEIVVADVTTADLK